MPFTVNFTDDLPNGPYCSQTNQGLKVFIGQQNSVFQLKEILENYGSSMSQNMDVQSRGVMAPTLTTQMQINLSWNVQAIFYKGGAIPFEISLMQMNNGDEMCASISQKMNTKIQPKGCCCCTLI